MTDTQAGLLPCPFCGNAPLLDHATLVRDTYHWVRCANEKCSVLPGAGSYLREADAITAWNRRTSPQASAEVVERVARAIDPVAWRWIDDMERDAPDHIALATTKQNRLDTAKRAIQASGAAVQVPEGWVLVKRSDRAERSWEGDESGRYQHSCAACQRGFSGPKWQNLCRVCTEFPPVRHPADVERSRAEAMKIAEQLAAPHKQESLGPMHLKLLRRGATGSSIGLSSDMAIRSVEQPALRDLHRLGFAAYVETPVTDGPKGPRSSVITDAGRAALAAAAPQKQGA